MPDLDLHDGSGSEQALVRVESVLLHNCLQDVPSTWHCSLVLAWDA